MVEITRLGPHDPLPEGRGHRVIVLRRFDEDDPRRQVNEIILTGRAGYSETARPARPDGKAFPIENAIAAARKVAESEGISQVYVIDRTEGRLEHDVVEHGGDHSFPGKVLDDTDLEDGEPGPDMRDRTP